MVSFHTLPASLDAKNSKGANFQVVNHSSIPMFGGRPMGVDSVSLKFGYSKTPGIQNSLFPDRLLPIQNTQAFKFATLVQQRLTYPVNEIVIAKPMSNFPGSQDWNGGVYTHVVLQQSGQPTNQLIRVGRTRNAIDRGGQTWIERSDNKGITWQSFPAITKDDETDAIRQITGNPTLQVASVERPYVYQKIETNGAEEETKIVLGTCIAIKDSKIWHAIEREAPLDNLALLKTVKPKLVLEGTPEYAYKDGVPVQAPPGDTGIYTAFTRHHLNLGTGINEPTQKAVNADTVLGRLSGGKYAIVSDTILPRGARRNPLQNDSIAMDETCNRLSAELVFPDNTRFWACDIRNMEAPNAAKKTHIQVGDLKQWQLGDFDEVTSFAVAQWSKGEGLPKVTSVDAILGRSWNPKYPTLRYLGIALLLSPEEFKRLPEDHRSGLFKRDEKEADKAALVLTYEKAGWRGAKRTYLQTISKKELAEAITAKDGQTNLYINQDPGPTRREQLIPSVFRPKVSVPV